MSTSNWRRLLILGVIVSGVALGLVLAGCSSGPEITPRKSYEQEWIEAHPTHAGPNGECVEFDDEPCDADPHDLDDLREARIHKSPSAKPSAKVSPKATRPTATPSARRTQ